MSSVPLVLAKANAAARAGQCSKEQLDSCLSPAQSGAALRLIRSGAITITGKALASVSEADQLVGGFFLEEGRKLLGSRLPFWEDFEEVASKWFHPTATPAQQAAGGYWLSDAFIRGVNQEEAARLTKFLIGDSGACASPGRRPSVRRYPTGGISEKQALLLPPLIRTLSEEIDWCAPFLIAPKLAHTGGTRDKLSVLPGFQTSSIADLMGWDGRVRPVRYFSADRRFCGRDAVMYKMRGETGTVADPGLMAASIMSKQIALPSDVIVLDILYGDAAFLRTAGDASGFGEMCQWIGAHFGTDIVPKIRQADGVLGKAVGASTEVVEASELLSGNIVSEKGAQELDTAVEFLAIMGERIGFAREAIRDMASDALSNGKAFDAMITLWAEHGVSQNFLDLARADVRFALLRGLDVTLIRAKESGVIHWNAIQLADVINNFVNVRGEDARDSGVKPGGIELVKQNGVDVAQGDAVAVLYGGLDVTSGHVEDCISY